MTVPFPSPITPVADRRDVLLGYLDYFRSVLVAKLVGLSEDELRRSRLPSGWAPLELVKHLTYVERRWLEWGFAGIAVPDPWGDRRSGRQDDPWYVAPDETATAVLVGLDEQAATTRRIVEAHELADVGAPGPRWDGAAPATLERVLLHVLQEYARHAGHLDVARELLDGAVGEDRPQRPERPEG